MYKVIPGEPRARTAPSFKDDGAILNIEVADMLHRTPEQQLLAPVTHDVALLPSALKDI